MKRERNLMIMRVRMKMKMTQNAFVVPASSERIPQLPSDVVVKIPAGKRRRQECNFCVLVFFSQ
jgi:hypothetical protein